MTNDCGIVGRGMYRQLIMTAATLWANATLGRRGAARVENTEQGGTLYRGLSLAPDAHFGVRAYFDDDEEGIPIPRGSIVKRDFRKVAIETLSASPQLSGSVAGWVSLLHGAPLPICPQSVPLRVWERLPTDLVFTVSPHVTVVQLAAINPAPLGVASDFLAFHCPGAELVTLHAADSGANATTFDLFGARGEVSLDALSRPMAPLPIDRTAGAAAPIASVAALQNANGDDNGATAGGAGLWVFGDNFLVRARAQGNPNSTATVWCRLRLRQGW